MKNIELLFKSNKISTCKIKLRNKNAVIKISDELISGFTLKRIAEQINAIHMQYNKIKVPIIFSFYNFEFIDKLTFIIFECMCYDLICNYGHFIQIELQNSRCDIYTSGINSSPLLLLNKTSVKSVKKFSDKFKKDLFGNHFRKLVHGDSDHITNYLGNLYAEVDSFLKPFNVEENSRDEIANVISELVGNGCEHGDGDCLIDIDVATNYHKVNTDKKQKYYAINISIINFSNKLLGDGIKKNILENENYDNYNERYKTVLKAYKNHKERFDDKYQKEDFCNITTFQHKISGRNSDSMTGGTGLTKLIQSLEEQSEAYRCYVISGSRALNFYKEFLEYDEDKWIGFNKEKDYVSEIPNRDDRRKEVISEALMYLPGTAYNLNFVMKIEGE